MRVGLSAGFRISALVASCADLYGVGCVELIADRKVMRHPHSLALLVRDRRSPAATRCRLQHTDGVLGGLRDEHPVDMTCRVHHKSGIEILGWLLLLNPHSS